MAPKACSGEASAMVLMKPYVAAELPQHDDGHEHQDRHPHVRPVAEAAAAERHRADVGALRALGALGFACRVARPGDAGFAGERVMRHR